MFLKPIGIEEIIVDQLKTGPKKTVALVGYVEDNDNGTKQGVYKAIKKLKEEEIITISNKEVSLSSLWLKKMNDFFALAQYYYKQPLTASSFLSLSSAQKISFSLKDLTELDIFSAHVFYLLNQVINKNEPIFAFNYHQWFYYGREENDQFLSYSIKKKQQPLLLLLGNKNDLDFAVKKIYNEGTSQCDILEKKIFPRNYYFIIIGEFLIECYLDEKVVNLLDDFFQKYKKFDSTAQQELTEIINLKCKNRMVISKNSKKIEKLKKIFKRYFLFK
jgi:hypothetical protein